MKNQSTDPQDLKIVGETSTLNEVGKGYWKNGIYYCPIHEPHNIAKCLEKNKQLNN